MFNCSTNCLCPIRFATNGSTSLLSENFYLVLKIDKIGSCFQFQKVEVRYLRK